MAEAAKRSLMKPQSVTVVVKNLPSTTTSDQLLSLCQNFGEIVEVEIPQKATSFMHFIYGFVRYNSLEVALNAVLKLNSLVIQGRQLSAEVARKHWRNTNDKTVLYDEPHTDKEEEVSEDELTEEELNTRILQLCHQQWKQHCRENRERSLPSFHKIMDMLTKTFHEEDEVQINETVSYSQGQNLDEGRVMY